MKRVSFFAVLLFGLGLASCTSTPDEELLAAASSGAGKTIGGATLDACVSKAQPGRRAISDAVYEAGATYQFASKMKKTEIMAPYAPRIRIYSVKIEVRNLLGGTVPDSYLCIYDGNGGTLRYLDYLRIGREGKSPRMFYDASVLRSYAIMAGKNPSTVVLLGAWAG
jgi:hypothetical protein